MEQSEPLRGMAGDLARLWTGTKPAIYFPGDEIPDHGQAPEGMATTPDGDIILTPTVQDYYGVDRSLSHAQQLSLLMDALHHEAEHVNQTMLDQIKQISDEHGGLAAHIFNTVEDQYINRTRTERDRGMRRNLAFKAQVAVMDHADDVSELDERERYLDGINQLCWGGYIKGFSNLSDDDKQLFAWVRRELEVGRRQDDQEDRIETALRIAKKLSDETDVEQHDTRQIPD